MNLIWLLSASSLDDPYCLMEVCAAVRHGIPVFPIRLRGAGVRPLDLSVWREESNVSPHDAAETFCDVTKGADGGNLLAKSGRDGVVPGNGRGDGRDNDARRGSGDVTRKRVRRRQLDLFYAQFARALPKATQEELHRNRFLVRDVIAGVRSCLKFGGFDEGGGGGDSVIVEAPLARKHAEVSSTSGEEGESPIIVGENATTLNATRASVLIAPPPRTFNMSEISSHQGVLADLVGIVSIVRKEDNQDAEAVTKAGSLQRKREGAAWNWGERLPEISDNAGRRMRSTEAVPWRTDEELSELIRQERAEADDLAGGV